MKDTELIIQLTPPIDGVQYGISTEIIKENDYFLNSNDIVAYATKEAVKFNAMSPKSAWNKILFSTNPKDTRFPYLPLPSKEQEVEKLAKEKARKIYGENEVGNKIVYFYAGACFANKHNPAKYTQEQMEKAIKLAREEECNGGVKYETFEIIQSLQPTAKAVRVEMEENCLGSTFTWKCNCVGGKCENMDGYKIKVETSSEFEQGIVRAIEVIY